jgi:hypothetical protein
MVIGSVEALSIIFEGGVSTGAIGSVTNSSKG